MLAWGWVVATQCCGVQELEFTAALCFVVLFLGSAHCFSYNCQAYFIVQDAGPRFLPLNLTWQAH